MNETTNVLRLRQPDEIDDPLTGAPHRGGPIACAGDRDRGRDVSSPRCGIPSSPTAVTGLCGMATARSGASRPVPISRVKIRDRGANGEVDRVRFSSSILPKWARRTRSLDTLLPVLYLRGVSTGDFRKR